MTEYKSAQEIKSIAKEVTRVKKQIEACPLCFNKKPCQTHAIFLEYAQAGKLTTVDGSEFERKLAEDLKKIKADYHLKDIASRQAMKGVYIT